MTVTNTQVRSDAFGDGVSVTFTYGFKILEETEMAAYVSGVLDPTVVVTGVGNPLGGTVTFATPPPDQAPVSLIRMSPRTQEVDYVAFGAFPADSHELALDRAALRDQEIDERADRSLHYPVETLPSYDAELPAPEPFKAIGYDNQGRLVNLAVGDSGGNIVTTPMSEDLTTAGFQHRITDVALKLIGRLFDVDPHVRLTVAQVGGQFQVVADGGGLINGSPVVTLDTLPPDTIISDTPPPSPSDGTSWFQSTTGRLLTYYDDGDSQQWVEVGPGLGAASSADLVTISDNAPTSPEVGDFWFKSDVGRLYFYYDDGNSQQWLEIGPAPGVALDISGRLFSAEKTTQQALTAGVDNELIQWDAGSKVDPDSEFAEVAGRYTPLMAGAYQVNANLNIDTIDPGELMRLEIRKNGTDVVARDERRNDRATGGRETSTAVSCIVALDGLTDFLSVFATTTGADGNTSTKPGSVTFSAARVGDL